MYRVYHTFRRMLLLLIGLVCSIALAGLMRQWTQTQLLRERYQTQTIQCWQLKSGLTGNFSKCAFGLSSIIFLN